MRYQPLFSMLLFYWNFVKISRTLPLRPQTFQTIRRYRIGTSLTFDDETRLGSYDKMRIDDTRFLPIDRCATDDREVCGWLMVLGGGDGQKAVPVN